MTGTLRRGVATSDSPELAEVRTRGRGSRCALGTSARRPRCADQGASRTVSNKDSSSPEATERQGLTLAEEI